MGTRSVSPGKPTASRFFCARGHFCYIGSMSSRETLRIRPPALGASALGLLLRLAR